MPRERIEEGGKQYAATNIPNAAPSQPRGLNLDAKLKAHTWGSPVRGVIEDYVLGEAKVITDDAIAEGTTLRVEVTPFAFDGEVLACYPRGDRFEVHVTIRDAGPPGLRKTPRFPVKIPCRVFSSCLDAPQEAIIVDISGEGLGLQTSVKLENEVTLAIESQSNIALGLVKHTRQLAPAMYRTGVMLHHIIPRYVDSELISPPDRSLRARASRLGQLAMRAFGKERKIAPR